MTSTASPRLAAVVRAAAPLVTDVAVRAHVVALLAEFGVDEPTAQRWFDSGVSEADGDRVTRLRAVVDASEPTDVEQAGTGAFYTPPDLAEHIVESAIASWNGGGVPTLADPCCGGGAVLLAAVELLVRRNASANGVLAGVAGADIDPVAVATTRLVLGLWSLEQTGAWSEVDVRVLDAVHGLAPSDWVGRFDLVVGNPPFLGQLKARTARSAGEREAVGPRGYADAATLSLDRSLDWVRDGGVVALLQPRSFLGVRDADATRQGIAERHRLAGVWVDDRSMFDAGVRVCLPVVQRVAGHATASPSEGIVELSEGLPPRPLAPTAAPTSGDWSSVGAAANGVPTGALAAVTSTATLGDIAVVQADFRDWFYEVADAVEESESADDDVVRVLTSGAIEPLRTTWGRSDVTILRRRFAAPVVSEEWLAGRTDGARRSAPKVVVANQTKVLEVFVDAAGRHVGVTPTLSVVPNDPADLSLVAAVLASPLATAHVATRTLSLGLSPTAMRVTAASLRTVPLPSDREAWDRAAGLVADGASPTDVAAQMATAWPEVDRAATESLHTWWAGRLRPGQA